MSTYEKINPENERELEDIIFNEPETVEEGFSILARQLYTTYGGKLDLLGLDNSGKMVVIELKVTEDDGMFAQALDYFAWVNDNIDSLKRMFPEYNIDENQTPRIVLIAPSFSDNVRRRITHVRDDINISLNSYSLLKHAGEKLVVFNEIPPIIPSTTPRNPPTKGDLINYIQLEEIKNLYTEAVDFVHNLNTDIKENITAGYIAFRYRNSPQLFYLGPRRQGFRVDVLSGDEYEGSFISSKTEWEESKSKIIKIFEEYKQNQ